MQTKIAKGTAASRDADTRQIAIRFDGDIFEKIALKAQAAGVSFAEQVRILVGRGLDRENVNAAETK